MLGRKIVLAAAALRLSTPIHLSPTWTCPKKKKKKKGPRTRMITNKQLYINTKSPITEKISLTPCHQSLYNYTIRSLTTTILLQHNLPHPVPTTMSPKLKPLLLPLLVEERRKRESISEPETDFSPSLYTQNSSTSSSSEMPSPVTPTFSTRGHLRYPSSASSIESSLHTSVAESPSSPTFVGLSKTSKRSLPDVQEEPQEKEEDIDMFKAAELYHCLCKYQFGELENSENFV